LVEVAEIAQHARQMEEHLDLHAAPADALVGPGLVPHRGRALERLDRFARPVQLLEAVAAPEQAEMICREGDERAVVPAQRLRPFLLALEVPADRTVEDRRPARRELRAPQQVALHLFLVSEHAEGTPDLVEQIGGAPEVILWRVVEAAVTGNDQLVLTAGRQEANLREDRIHLAHPCVPSPRPAPQPSSTLPPVPPPSVSVPRADFSLQHRDRRVYNSDLPSFQLDPSSSHAATTGSSRPRAGRSPRMRTRRPSTTRRPSAKSWIAAGWVMWSTSRIRCASVSSVSSGATRIAPCRTMGP